MAPGTTKTIAAGSTRRAVRWLAGLMLMAWIASLPAFAQHLQAAGPMPPSLLAEAGQPPTSAKAGASPRHWKIMPFGDSITRSGCYIARLWRKLRAEPLGDFDLVGTQGVNGCGEWGVPQRSEGHNCYAIAFVIRPAGTGSLKGCNDGDTFVGDSRDLVAWFENAQPDIVLWHIGTNDARFRIPLSETLQGYSTVLETLRRRNPDVVILVAKIVPVVERKTPGIPGWAAANATPRSPIHVVDMHTGFDPAWMPDGVHPSADHGAAFMAETWYRALKPVMQAR